MEGLKDLSNDDLIAAWWDSQSQLAAIKKEESVLRAEVQKRMFVADRKGTQTRELGNGYQLKLSRPEVLKIKATPQEVESLLHDIAMMDGGIELAKKLISYEPKLDKKTYTSLEAAPAIKVRFDEIIEKSYGSAKVEIKEPKGE